MTNHEAARDIRALSAGTIGTLTGLRKYQEIDKIRETVAQLVENTPMEFASWATGWNLVYGATPTISGDLLETIDVPTIGV